MEVLNKVKELYQFYKDNDIDTNVELIEFEYDSDGFLILESFNEVSMRKAIDDEEIVKLVSFL